MLRSAWELDLGALPLEVKKLVHMQRLSAKINGGTRSSFHTHRCVGACPRKLMNVVELYKKIRTCDFLLTNYSCRFF